MAKYKVNIVGVDTSKLKTIPCAKTIELIKKYKENRDSILFDEIVQGNRKLVLLVVNKYGKKVDNLDDLFQIGTIGLLKAIENFDLSIDVKFSTYAVPMIEGEIRRFLRDSSFLRVSRQIKDLSYHYLKEKEKYINEYGEIPTLDYFKEKLHVSNYELQEAIEASLPVTSLDEPLYQDDNDSLLLQEVVSDNVDNHQKLVVSLSLKEGIESLDKMSKTIIMKRYYEGRSQVELAEEFHISQAQISRLEKEALRLLRKYVI